ncbi:hypothetical protein Tco_0015472 [Tanacetum coccineum]
MAAPLSPDHVFDFLADEPHDFDDFDLKFGEDLKEPEEENKEDFKEDPEEDPKEEEEEFEWEEDIPHVAAPHTELSPTSPPPLSESSSDFEFTAPVTANGTHWVLPFGSTFEVDGPSSLHSLSLHLLTRGFKRLRDDTEILFSGVRCLEQGARTRQAEINANRLGINKLSGRMDAFNTNLGFIKRDATRTSDNVLALQEGRASNQEKIGKLKRRLDSLKVAERMGRGAIEARPSNSIDVLAVYGTAQPPEPQGPPDGSQVAEPIAEYERNKANNPENAGGTRPVNAGVVNASKVHGCSYKTFLNWKPHSFNGSEGVVGLSHWFKMMESMFKIRYNNRFHELALMCPDLVTPKRKKIKRYVQGLPERVKSNVTSSKLANLHEAINMAHHQRNHNNRNINTYHQQQNIRKEAAKAYVAGPAEGRGYAGNLPLCNQCKAHHYGLCPPRCGKCHKLRHHEKDC